MLYNQNRYYEVLVLGISYYQTTSLDYFNQNYEYVTMQK